MGHKVVRSLGSLSAEAREEGEVLRSLGSHWRIWKDDAGWAYIPCKRGVQVFVIGKGLLGVYVPSTRKPTLTAKALLDRFHGSAVRQLGDSEVTVSVPVAFGKELLQHLGARFISQARQEIGQRTARRLHAARSTGGNIENAGLSEVEAGVGVG